MNNPENMHHTIDVSTMYTYQHHENIPWVYKEYRTPKMEMNVDLELKKRKWATQKKGQKDNKYITKKGFYMDYDLKVAKGVPSPNDHGSQHEWSMQKDKKRGASLKIDPKLSKNTYIDQIQTQFKNRKQPGVCAYNLQKSIKQKQEINKKLGQKKRTVGQKVYFYYDTQAISNHIPGSGQYSPHQPAAKVRLNKTDYKFWVEKHKKQNQAFKKRQSARPAPGSFDPMNTTLTTFDRLAQENKKPNKKHLFGDDSRFEYTRPQKSKHIETRPSPSSYRTMIDWKGKDVSPKKVEWTDKIWKGQSLSVYH